MNLVAALQPYLGAPVPTALLLVLVMRTETVARGLTALKERVMALELFKQTTEQRKVIA